MDQIRNFSMLRHCRYIMLLAVVASLSACGNSSNPFATQIDPDTPPSTDPVTNPISGPGVGQGGANGQLSLSLFNSANAIQRLDRDNIFALITINGTQTRYDQSDGIELSFNVQNGQRLQLLVEWFERFNDTDLLLGRYTFEQIITADTAISIRDDQYITKGQNGDEFDVDDDGRSNLEERIDDTNPLSADPAPSDTSIVSTTVQPVTAVNLGNVFALVRSADGVSRFDQSTEFSLDFNVQNGQNLALDVAWFTNVRSQDLLLGSFRFDETIIANRNLLIQSTDYTTQGDAYDADSDGFSNLEELLKGTNPLDLNDTPANIPDVRINRIDPSIAPVIDGLYDRVWNNAQFSDAEGRQLAVDNLMVNQGALRPDGQSDQRPKMRWFGMHDDTYLYLFVLGEPVDTANPIRDSGSTVWQDDNLNIFIDGNNSKLQDYDGIDDRQILIPLLTSEADPSSNNSVFATGDRSAPLPTFVFESCFCRSDQHTWEIRIPMAEFGIRVGSSFGLDIQIDLDHDGGARDAKWGWFHPSRVTKDVDNTWRNPSFMGTAVASSG